MTGIFTKHVSLYLFESRSLVWIIFYPYKTSIVIFWRILTKSMRVDATVIQYRQRGFRIGPRYRHGTFIIPTIHHRVFLYFLGENQTVISIKVPLHIFIFSQENSRLVWSTLNRAYIRKKCYTDFFIVYSILQNSESMPHQIHRKWVGRSLTVDKLTLSTINIL